MRIRRRTRYTFAAALAVMGLATIPITVHAVDPETDAQKCERVLNGELDKVITDAKAGREIDPDPRPPIPACDKLAEDQKLDIITRIWTERQDEIWDVIIYNELQEAHSLDELKEAKDGLAQWFKAPAEWPEETAS